MKLRAYLGTRGRYTFLGVTVSSRPENACNVQEYKGPTRRAVNLERVRLKVADTHWILLN